MSKTIEITLRINVEIEDDSAINHPIIVDFDQEQKKVEDFLTKLK